MSIFPRETKGVLSSVRNKQPMKKSPCSSLKNWGTKCKKNDKMGASKETKTIVHLELFTLRLRSFQMPLKLPPECVFNLLGNNQFSCYFLTVQTTEEQSDYNLD